MYQPKFTVGFSTTKKLMSCMIRKITGSSCSHAWFCYNSRVDNSNKLIRQVAQAEWFGYESRPRWRWNTQNVLVAEFELIGPDPTEAVSSMLLHYLGSRYDYRSAFLTGTWRLFGRWVKSLFRDPSKLMCVEGVIYMLGRAGYDSVRDLDPEFTSPGELLKACENNPKEFKLLNTR